MTTSSSYNKPGFTLIETLFAVLIFSAALISLMIIASRGISATANVQQETVAHYLAQEGIEVVRNLRDTNFSVHGGAWDAGFGTGQTPDCSAGACNVVYSTASAPTLASCTVGACPVYESPADGSFVNGPTASAPYRREISVVKVGSDEYQVYAKVFWTAKNIDRSVVLQTILKKWQ